MSAHSGRRTHVFWLTAVAWGVVSLAGVTLIAIGAMGLQMSLNVWPVVAGLMLVACAVLALAVVGLLVRMESTAARQLGELRDMRDILDKQLTHMGRLVENTGISDAAKSLVHRDHELDSLRQTIRAVVRREDWEGALHLVEEMERRFGYREEAANLRIEIREARHEAMERKLREALALIDEHCARFDWQLARNEVDRLLRLLPEDPRVVALPGRLKTLWEQRKEALLAEWKSAVAAHDVDRAIHILKDLDLYLTPEQASELQGSARAVFKEKLMQLGVQFRFAVTEHRWHDALAAGAELIREFPNTRMAQEVRERLDILRERAKHAEARPGGATPVSAATAELSS